MRILINDFETEKDVYKNIFKSHGYENNELIFCCNYDDTKNFIVEHVEKRKLHIDLIITNDNSNSSNDELRASELSYLKSILLTSYSKSNFRISSIPIILFSNWETKSAEFQSRFNSIVKKEESSDLIITESERVIKEWRKNVFKDLEVLGLNINGLSDFKNTLYYKNYYKNNISKNYENYFSLKTNILSYEFIQYPTPLIYDWTILNNAEIEKLILEFNKTYKRHKKYDRKNNERTILHQFFNDNQLILLRDSYSNLEYEKNLYDLNARTSEECDFILKTEYPEFLNTAFFEVKKEDVTFYVKKNTKRPQMNADFTSHLKQVWGYKEFAENPINQPEIVNKIGYNSQNFEYILLAGRKEEKLEMKAIFDKEVNRMFNTINVITYEELEEINIDYLDKFNRINSDFT